MRYFIQICSIAVPMILGLIGAVLILKALPGVIASFPASYWIGILLCLACYIGLMMRASVREFLQYAASGVHHFVEKTW